MMLMSPLGDPWGALVGAAGWPVLRLELPFAAGSFRSATPQWWMRLPAALGRGVGSMLLGGTWLKAERLPSSKPGNWRVGKVMDSGVGWNDG
jgi:hypothetical protein